MILEKAVDCFVGANLLAQQIKPQNIFKKLLFPG